MLIYILHSDKYYTFRLPKEISGSHILNDYDHNGDKRSLVNISASGSKWMINSNETVKIIQNNKYVNSAELVPNSYYLLETDKGEKILLSTQLGYDDNYIIKEANNGVKITIGNDEKCDIIYNLSNIAKQQLSMEYKNGCWIVTNLEPKIPVYVNKVRTDHIVASNFDCVFVLGLKIVLCGPLLFINNSNKLVTHIYDSIHTYQPKLCIANKKNIETYNDFYDAESYFSKSPTFVRKNNHSRLLITSPEGKEQNTRGSFLMELIPTIVMEFSSVLYFMISLKDYRSGNMDKDMFIISIVMMTAMMFTGLVWPFIERFVEKIYARLREKRRIKLYKKYLQTKRNSLDRIKDDQRAVLLFNYLSLSECQDVIFKKNTNLFSVGPEQDRFLNIKLGTGRVPIDCDIDYSKPDFIKEKDKMLDLVDNLIDDYKYVDNVPYVCSLKQNIAFINSKNEFYKYYEAIILKLITFSDYNDLKIVLFTSKDSRLNKIKSLNHCWDNERSTRFVANDLQEAETLSSYLMRIFNSRLQENDKAPIPHYFIICDEVNMYKNVKIINSVLQEKGYHGFSVVSFSQKVTEVMEGFDTFISYDDAKASLFKSEMQEEGIDTFVPELMNENINFNKCVSIVANTPIRLNEEASGLLPEKYGFLEMYGVGNVNQLNSAARWKDPKVINSLAAPIGVDTNNNLIYLDLHEKKHGPHGLIAGMTGSGKSEFIVTYILSLAINYSPEEVQFVLIDYKGGGLASAFENRKEGIKLPHLVGTITNLDISEMSRTLVSIKSELERRQLVFNKVKNELNTGNLDIYKYQSLYREGLIDEPLSHLFIICDEFAELKQSQPEFMDEIVSASRIGRSLGIHLILATQKPTGVVDDQVWSNSKFKVCCKVQTAEDSQEMLKKPDAAYLKESGRFYLQVGYDEYYILGQSGYSGTKYIPSETVISRFDNSIAFVTDSGEVYKKVSKKDKEKEEKAKKDFGEELNNILRYIIETSEKEGYKYNQLWLDNVPDHLYYNDLVKKYPLASKRFDINPIIGEYDNPRNQSQGYVTLPITTGGNTYIVGSSRSGKNTLLSTIIFSTILNHASEEINFYLIDFGSEKLRKFSKAPQVGNVLTMSDGALINYLMYMLQTEQRMRQQYYSETGGDFLTDVKKGECPFPTIVVMIYEFDAFKEAYEDMVDEVIIPLTRNSSKYGINFIISGTETNSLSFSNQNNFTQKIVLNMTDPEDMSTFFEHPPIIRKNPGRGLVKINEVPYEFQTAMIFEEEKEQENLQYVIEQLNNSLKTRARPIPTVPEKVTFDTIKDYISDINAIPFGINLVTAQVGFYGFNDLVTLMSSSHSDDMFKFMLGFGQVLGSLQNNKTIILSSYSKKIAVPENVKYYNSSFKKIVPVLTRNIEKYNNGEKKSDDTYLILILGYSKLNSHLKKLKQENKNIKTLDEIIMAVNNEIFKFVIYDEEEIMSDLRHSDLSDYIDTSSGIWIGRDVENQRFFDVSSSDELKLGKDTVSLIINETVVYLKSFR